QVGWPEDSPAWYARQDAEGFAESLIKNFDFPSANVTMLLDEDATRERILSSFLEYVHAHVSHDDRIAVFFAGHGYTKTGHRGEIGYLVPVDGDPSSLSTLDSLGRTFTVGAGPRNLHAGSFRPRSSSSGGKSEFGALRELRPSVHHHGDRRVRQVWGKRCDEETHHAVPA